MLAEKIRDAKSVVIFTGAGMSTESGLPDFRSSHGVWQNVNPSEVATIEALNNNVTQFFEFYRTRVLGVREYQPNQGHYILAKWANEGLVSTIITQNVDGFHTAAGAPEVLELHGTLRTVHCQTCGKKYSNVMYEKQTYYCQCGGTLRPSVVLFGEFLDEHVMFKATVKSEKSTIFIVLGSSLTVSPANYFPELAKQHGAYLVIVNAEPTPLDAIADEVIQHERIGAFLTRIDEEITQLRKQR